MEPLKANKNIFRRLSGGLTMDLFDEVVFNAKVTL